MRKTCLILVVFSFLFVSFLPAQDSEADQVYIKAVMNKDPVQKVRMLKDYLAKYAGKGTKYENFANATLCLTPSNSITPAERITYAERTIALGGLDDLTRFQVYITAAGLYAQSGRSLDKAKNYALKAAQTAESAKSKEKDRANIGRWNKFIGAAYFTEGEALTKAKDYRIALKAYVKSYKILQNKQIVQSMRKLGKSLYDAKNFTDAEEAFKLPAQVLKDYGSLTYYARCLHRNGKKTIALKQYKLAYAKQKNGDIAFNIGILLAGRSKSNPSVADEAIQYLLDAAFLSKVNTKKAMNLAQALFFNTAHKNLQYNQKVKELEAHGKKLTDLTNAFNSKFGDKDEEDLSEDQKKEMNTILDEIETEKKNIQRLESETKAALEKFNFAIESAKKRLGIG